MLQRMRRTKQLTDGACSLNNKADVMGMHWAFNVFLSPRRLVSTIILHINLASFAGTPLLLVRLFFPEITINPLKPNE
jgi:hypothetical protein